MRINLFIFLGLILTQGVVAQGLKRLHVDESNIVKHQDFHQIEVFTKFHRLPEYKNISQKIRLLKKSKSTSPIYQVGDRSSFFVRDILALERWNVVSALCLYKSSSVAIWISEADLESYSDSLDIQLLTDSLNVYLETKTPSGSVNSDKGILEID